jgi:hypothetical protein
MKYDANTLAGMQEQYADQQRVINELKQNYVDLSQEQKALLGEMLISQQKLKGEIAAQVKLEKEIEASTKAQVEHRKKLLGYAIALTDSLKLGWKYLQESDKIIKQTILTLGMSGAKAEAMRVSFEQSIGHVSELGGTMEDIGKIQTGFADETGRARAMTASMVEDITAIGKGTGLGIEQATKLAAEFEYMGLNTKATLNYVQDVVDTSERMGVNTTKVLKNITDNFKKLGTFSFKNGTKAFAEMAMNAERTRVSMKSALDVAEAKRSLETVIELGANLQVMGGRFAEMDPFHWLYTVRNEPEKLTEQISEMTAGIYTLKKNSQGIFEEFISPADVDRLTNVANSLGIAKEEMFEIAKRKLALNTLDKQLSGLGLSKAQKELVAGAATLDTKTGKYQVMLAGTMRDISTMTAAQAKSFEQEQSTLADRAKEAQTFDEALKNTINALKGTLLPILRGVNAVLDFMRPVIKGLSNLAGSGWGGVGVAAGLLMGSALLWKVVLNTMNTTASNWSNKIVKNKGGGGSGTSGGRTDGGGAAGKVGGRSFGQSAGIGAAVGLAAAGVGAGIAIAAVGISKLADSMSKLTADQAKTLKEIVASISTMVTIAAGAAGAIALFSAAGATAAPAIATFGASLAIVGGAIFTIGAGIGIATAGIGYMISGMAKLNQSSGSLATSIASVATSMSDFKVNPQLLSTLNQISAAAPNFAMVGNAFKNMSLAMSGSKADYIAVQEAVEGISKANMKGGGMLSELATLLKSPLKVEFANNKVAIASDISLYIDGDKLMQKIFKADAAVQSQVVAIKMGINNAS